MRKKVQGQSQHLKADRTTWMLKLWPKWVKITYAKTYKKQTTRERKMSEGSRGKKKRRKKPIVEKNENRFLFRFQLCIALHLYTANQQGGRRDGRTYTYACNHWNGFHMATSTKDLGNELVPKSTDRLRQHPIDSIIAASRLCLITLSLNDQRQQLKTVRSQWQRHT